MKPTEILWRVQAATHLSTKQRVRQYGGMYIVNRYGTYIAIADEDFRELTDRAFGSQKALVYRGYVGISWKNDRQIAAKQAADDMQLIAVMEEEWAAGRFQPEYEFDGEDLGYAVDAFTTAYSLTYLTTSLTIHPKADGERWLQIDLRRNPTPWHFASRTLPPARGSFLVALSDIQDLKGSSLDFRLKLDGELLSFGKDGVVRKFDGLVTAVL